MKRSHSLIRRMTLCFVAVVVIVVAVLGIINMTLINRDKSDSLRKTFETVARNDAARIMLMATHANLLCDVLTDSKLTDSSKAYITYMMSMESDLVTSLKDYYELRDMILRDCRITVGSVFNSWSVNLFLSEEMPLSSQSFIPKQGLRSILDNYMEYENLRIMKDTLVREEDWYQQATKAKTKPVWLEKDGFIYFARSLSALNQGRNYGEISYYNMGVLLLIFRAESINDILESGRPTENSSIRLCNAEGDVLWMNQDPILHDALEITNEIQDGLRLIIHVPNKDIQKMTNNTFRTMALFLILCAGLGIVLVLMISGWITRPVLYLSSFMKEKKGELISGEMIPKPKDEIRNLYISYNELIHTIREEEAKRKKAEMDYLQMQINPHFLYNTLDTVCFMAMTAGQNKIADILSELAGIYRYNVKDFEAEVTLQEELNILGNYLDIYQSRSSDRIECRIDVEEELKDAVIPKMILQPLIENSILYGSTEGIGIICVVCSRTGDDMMIRVTDEGTEADTDRINAYLRGESEMPVHATGIGIRNVHQRIRIRYGTPYGLAYHRTAQGETCAEISLPCRFRSKDS